MRRHARQGCFPEAEKDPVIQIASMVTEHGSAKPLVRNVMTLGTCAPIVGSEVMSFSSEEELLKARPSPSTLNYPLPTTVSALHALCAD